MELKCQRLNGDAWFREHESKPWSFSLKWLPESVSVQNPISQTGNINLWSKSLPGAQLMNPSRTYVRIKANALSETA